MTASGHEDPFPRPGPNGRCRFGRETFTETRGNGRDPPVPADRRANWTSCLAARELAEQDLPAPGVFLGRHAIAECNQQCRLILLPELPDGPSSPDLNVLAYSRLIPPLDRLMLADYDASIRTAETHK
jgi:hypothetical protein